MSSLHAKQIFIFEDSDWVGEPVFGELHVLDDTSTTLHFAGSNSRFRTISFWMLDPTDDYPTLAADFKAGTTITLVDWLGNSTNVKIRSLQINQHLMDIKRSGSNYVVAKCSAKLQEIT